MIMEQKSSRGFKWDKQYGNTLMCDSCLINVSVTEFWIVFEVAYCLLKAENPGWAAIWEVDCSHLPDEINSKHN